jgi:hypothetical protein
MDAERESWARFLASYAKIGQPLMVRPIESADINGARGQLYVSYVLEVNEPDCASWTPCPTP